MFEIKLLILKTQKQLLQYKLLNLNYKTFLFYRMIYINNKDNGNEITISSFYQI